MLSFQSTAVLALALLCITSAGIAQRHDYGTAPPTAPPTKPLVVPQVIVPDPLSAGLGAMQYSTANALVSAPQMLAEQLQSSNDRVRTAALAAIDAPAQYETPGRVAFPHSVHLDFIALGSTFELDAVLTVEMDQHIVSAVLVPEDGVWHRLATATYATPFSDPATTPATFFQASRSVRQPQFYTAVFHTAVNSPAGDLTDTEVHLRIIDGHAVITMSFASVERTCDPTHQKPCEFTERWILPGSTDPQDEVTLVTATGHLHPGDSSDPMGNTESYEATHLRTFTCQPFLFSDTALHFDAVSDPLPCSAPRDQHHETSNDQPHDQPGHDTLHDQSHDPPHDTPHDTPHDQPLH